MKQRFLGLPFLIVLNLWNNKWNPHYDSWFISNSEKPVHLKLRFDSFLLIQNEFLQNIARGIISFIIPVMCFVNKVNSTGSVKWNFYWKYSCVFISMVTFFHLETIRSVFRWQFLITFIFSVSLQLRVYYIKDQWGEFTVKNATLYSHIPFLAYFLLLFIKKNVLLSFSFLFFDEVSSYRNIILTNQKLK